MKKGSAWFDGASLGNPGPAGAGAIVSVAGAAATTHAEALGRMTNNQAEYHGVLLALRAARAAGITHLVVHGDSQLVVRQLEGRYQVRNAGLRPLFDEAKVLVRGFAEVQFVWVPREENGEADAAAAGAAQAQR